ncbi:T-cell ecto-ADP-ribosyltransferase 1-like isoform X1 [Mastacembelus armatus]|uniref:T-cell ecto-ADP-ribosyltransferase 1-like isoform X1 n=1 Tax=Mastacembelus armatus TaxID=205130 RepID=UPI000E45CC4F|nr:T-cell ecto-ADP-ribosyltransferase 1-like isoform X1 [Mastacembelus armatus]
MWDMKKLLLAAITSIALYCTKATAKLDMAPNAVDDMYKGCHKEVMKIVHSDLLGQELNNSMHFQKAWNANTKCPMLIPGGTKEHTTAIMAYVNGDAEFTQTFDREVKTMGVNVSTYERFKFKSLHFLLMDSLRLLKPKDCKIMYIFTEKQHKLDIGATLSFGTFKITDLDYEMGKKMNDMDDLFLLNITSCFYINLTDPTCNLKKDMGLISPAEVFTVEKIYKRKDKDEDTEYTEIVLKHLNLTNSHNCYFFSRSPADVSTLWLVSMLVALSLFFAG